MDLFVAEGEKNVSELLDSDLIKESVFSTKKTRYKSFKIDIDEMKSISFLKTPSSVLGVFRIPKSSIEINDNEIIIALDSIKDPGNLGTIIRLCDWYGVRQILCSEDSVDCFNPKVVQSSMGSIARVNCLYLNLEEYLKNTSRDVYGACLNGDSIYKTILDSSGVYIFGSESFGISNSINKYIKKPLTIPLFNNNSKIDSLNIASANAIFLSEIFRNKLN